MREIIIAGRVINDSSDAWVCAELGCNHGGSVETGKQLIAAAASAGVDAVKLQKRHLPDWESRDPEAWARPYESEHSFGATYGEHRAALEFGWDEYVTLKRYAESLGLALFATAWDVPSLRFLADLEVPAIKLASASIVDGDLLRACNVAGLPVIFSTGGATFEEVDIACGMLDDVSKVVMACTSEYPCPPEHMNLNVVTTYRDEFPSYVVGLSDHYNGIALTAASYLLGARVIEKHFTLDRTMKGSDHRFSLEPAGLRKLVRDTRRMRLALGSPTKQRLDGEIPGLIKMGRSDLKTWVPQAFVNAR